MITDIQFLNNEQQPEVKNERGIIYDIYCMTDTGERIIVEMQNREQPYFKDRALFYLSRAITQLAKRGQWNFRLDAVYGVFFMNFVMDKDMPATIRTDVVLSDRATGKLFNDKFRQIFIELPNFNKEEDECNTDFERWIYILKHMDTLDRMPFKARKAVFERLEKLASKANMTQEERAQYEEEWKVYNDYFNTLDFAEKKGMQKGMQKEKEVTARIMKSKGLSLELISECTGLTTEEIEKLKTTADNLKDSTCKAEQLANEMVECAEIKELTTAIVNRLIEKIEVSEPQTIDGEKVQNIRIFYKFVGEIN